MPRASLRYLRNTRFTPILVQDSQKAAAPVAEVYKTWGALATGGAQPTTWAQMATGGSYDKTWAELT